MTFGLELFGVFAAGVLFTLVFLAVAIPKLGPRLIRWQMQRTMGDRAKAEPQFLDHEGRRRPIPPR